MPSYRSYVLCDVWILGSETGLYREFEDFPAMVYVATQKEEFRKEVIREASPKSSQGWESPERQVKEKAKKVKVKEVEQSTK